MMCQPLVTRNAGRAERIGDQPRMATLPVPDTLVQARTAGVTFASGPGTRPALPALRVVVGQ